MLSKIKSYCKQEDQGRNDANLNQDNNSEAGKKLAGKQLRFFDGLKVWYGKKEY